MLLNEISPTAKKGTILVTGGSGLVGSELIRQLLAQGKQVSATYHTTELPEFHSDQLQQFKCDILDVTALEEIMRGIEEVYHCAGIVKFDGRNEEMLYRINIEGTANVVNAAIDAGVKKMLHVSSIAALGRIREGEVVTEAMNWTPETSNSVYGKSKYLGEMEVWRGIGEGLDAVVVNPAIILGAGDWNAGSSKIFKSVYDEFPWHSDGVSGFVDVRDVAKAMIQLMESDISSQRFILSAANSSYAKLFGLIAKAFSKKPPHKKATPLLAAVVWRLEAIKSLLTGQKPLVTKETAVAAMAKVNYDNTKLFKFLPGFKYRSLEETVTYTCATLQQKLNNP